MTWICLLCYYAYICVYNTAPTYCQHIVTCAITTYIWHNIYIYIYDMNMSIAQLAHMHVYSMSMSPTYTIRRQHIIYIRNILYMLATYSRPNICTSPTHSLLWYYDIFITKEPLGSIWHMCVLCIYFYYIYFYYYYIYYMSRHIYVSYIFLLVCSITYISTVLCNRNIYIFRLVCFV